MNFHKTSLTVLTLLFGLLLTAPTMAVEVGKMAPDFTLASASGKNLRLADYRGKVVLVNFWATWCAPCRKELPYLEALYKKYKGKGFVLLGVNVDKNPDVAREMAAEFKVTFPVLFDNLQKVSKRYKLRAMPSTVIIDRSGKVRYVHLGYKKGYEKKYAKNIRALLAK